MGDGRFDCMRARKAASLAANLARLGERGLAVAFSGGVDSTYLLAAAHEALQGRVLALIASSKAFPADEFERAVAFCRERQIPYLVVDARETEAPGYRDNPPDRCYICKTALFGALWAAARAHGCEALADGSNLDDVQDYRPGMRALAELGVSSPLREAGLTKAEIRELSREMGLATWDKPSLACLASRFPYGERITDQALERVELAERHLRDLGFAQVRVRVHGGTAARIEVLPAELERMVKDPLRTQVHERLKELGFSYVSLDLMGYRTGSLNEALGR